MDATVVPAGPPPSGVVPDLVHPQSWKGLDIAIATSCVGVTFVATGIRVFTKLHIMRTFNYEDYTLVAATVCGAVYAFLCLSPVEIGAEHIWDRPLSSLPDWFFYVNLIVVFWEISIMFAKWSLLTQLSRVFAAKRYSNLWWFVNALIWATTVAWLICIFMTIFLCTPREKIWQPEIPGHCFDLSSMYLATGVLNLLLNCAILSISPFGLKTLNVSRRQKISIAVMFSVSALALGCSIGRLYATVVLTDGPDFTHNNAPEAYWAGAELVFFILATVFPTIPRFWQWCRSHTTQRSSAAEQRPANFSSPRHRVGAFDEETMLEMRYLGAAGAIDLFGRSLAQGHETTVTASVSTGRPLRHQDSGAGESGILRTVEFDGRSVV